MALTILSWIFILFIFLVAGITVSGWIRSLTGYRVTDFFSVLMIGLVCTTLYAQFFSLFDKVGRSAFIVTVLICGAELIFFRKQFRNMILRWVEAAENDRSRLLLLTFIILSVVLFGSYISSRTPPGYPGGYDSYNYHIPAIRWLEEYGIVKGLGNLHTRFAYNSSFLCLQALFSFSWIYDASMHSLNGFFWVFTVIFAFSRLWLFAGKRFSFSDLLRIILLFILFQPDEWHNVPSPHTDFLPMCLSGYIFIQWSRYGEEQAESPIPYGLLSLLGVFSATVKLSAGILILFAVFPLIDLLRMKAYKLMCFFLTAGLFVMMPFVIRNLIISGYLVYPMYRFDLFNFDWEIPRSVIVSDQIMIKLYARSWGKGYAYEDYTRNLIQWVKIWLEKADSYYGILGGLDIILCIMILCCTVWHMIVNKKISCKYALPLIGSAGFIFLLLTAPGARFGRWWFFLVPAICIYYLCRRDLTTRLLNPTLSPFVPGMIISLGLLGCTVLLFYKDIARQRISGSFLIHPNDYIMEGSSGGYADLNGIRFYYYVPVMFERNHLNGYDGFPGTECLSTLSRIEMRGEDLSDGFRTKDDMWTVPYDFQGAILSPEQVRILGLDDRYDTATLLNYEDNAYKELLLSDRIPDEELKDYTAVTGELKSEIEHQSADPDGICTIDGWAYLISAPDPEMGEICVRYGDALYLVDEIMRQDVADTYGLSGSRIGFLAAVSSEDPVSVCIIDREGKIIYN